MLSLWRKGEEQATPQAQTAPQSLFCISPCFLTLPSPSSPSLQNPPLLPGASPAVANAAQKTRAGSWSDRQEPLL